MKHASEYCYSPPGRDASLSQGYPQQYVAGAHLKQWTKVPCLRKQFIYLFIILPVAGKSPRSQAYEE